MFFFGKISSDQAVTSCLDWILRNSFWNIWVYQEFEVYIIFQKLFQPFMVEKLSMLCRVGLGCQLCTFSPTHHSRPWSSDNKINDWQRHIGLRSSSWTFNAFGDQPQECPAPDEVSPGRRKANPTTALVSTNRSLLATGISIHPTTFLPDPVEFVVVVKSRTLGFLFWSMHSPPLGDYVFPFSNLPRDA